MRCVHARENTRHERERVSNARQTQRTIVSANERIGVLVLQLTVDVLFSLLHRNVHEAVQATQDAWRSRRTKKKHDDNKSQISMPRATTRRDATQPHRDTRRHCSALQQRACQRLASGTRTAFATFCARSERKRQRDCGEQRKHIHNV